MIPNQRCEVVESKEVRQVFDFFSNLGNIYIERQDLRMVVTQRPFHSELRMDEKLVPGDAPVIEYCVDGKC